MYLSEAAFPNMSAAKTLPALAALLLQLNGPMFRPAHLREPVLSKQRRTLQHSGINPACGRPCRRTHRIVASVNDEHSSRENRTDGEQIPFFQQLTGQNNFFENIFRQISGAASINQPEKKPGDAANVNQPKKKKPRGEKNLDLRDLFKDIDTSEVKELDLGEVSELDLGNIINLSHLLQGDNRTDRQGVRVIQIGMDDDDEDDDDEDDDDDDIPNRRGTKVTRRKLDKMKKLNERLGRVVKKITNSRSLRSSLDMPGIIDITDLDDEEDDDDEEDELIADPIRNFDLKPKEIVDHLNRYVIQQSDAKKVLAVAISDHYNHCRRFIDTPPSLQPTNYAKPNILLAGPTGVGKTYLMKTIAKLIGVPFVKADATKFSETGVVGKDVEDLVRDLVDAAGGNVTAAQFGIIYVDEVDKIASGSSSSLDIRGVGMGRGVQNNFLKLLEDTDVSLQSDLQKMRMQMVSGSSNAETISTRNILFIFSGAFTSLDNEIKRKKGARSMGFALDDNQVEERDKSGSYLRFAETADFVSAGLESEFVGRVPVRVALNALDENDLKQILTNAEDNVLTQFIRDFEGHNITMTTDEEALTQVARLAVKEATGARGLVTVLERVLREHKYELPSSSVAAFELNNATVVSPTESLAGLLSSQTEMDKLNTLHRDVKRWEQYCAHQVGDRIRPVINDEAFDEFVSIAQASNVSIYSAIVHRFRKISSRLPVYLLNHLNKTTQTELHIGLDFVRQPEDTLASYEELLERA
mmetsp:Transcript_39489/g.62682  ORF Transcript_39489/g.62682 Transcript_39489/m.62682 type:complete len:754 (-) Transcript_39489:156-2417(-)